MIYILLLLCLTFLGCAANGNEVTVSVVNNSDKTLTDVRIISGGDKFYSTGVEAGTNNEVSLWPGQASDYQVTFFYSVKDHQSIWESDSLPAGNDYLLEVLVTNDSVQAQYCARPCRLP